MKAVKGNVFAVEIKGKVNAWDLQIEKQINSFDFAKLNNSFRFKFGF